MKYEVTVTREDGFWVGVVEGLRGGATETRRLSALHDEVVDLVSGLTDIDPERIELRMNYEHALSAGAFKCLGSYEEAQVRLEVAEFQFEIARSELIHELQVSEVSLRDSSHLLGISFQRVSQLVKALRR